MMERISDFINKHRFECITGALFFIYFILTLTITYCTYTNWLTSDMSAELVAAKQAFDEGHILSPNWYYGTELRLLTPTLLYQFLFLFTSDFYIIRSICLPINLIILFLSLYFLLRQSKYQRYFFVVGTLMLLPMSVGSSYYMYVISGYQMYVYYIALMFISIGLMFYYFNHEDKVRKIISLCLIGLIAILCGINSPRHLLVLYFPLLLTCLLLYLVKLRKGKFKKSLTSENAQAVYISLGAIACNAIGLLIYFNVMMNHFHLAGYGIKFAWPNGGTFNNALKAFANCLGFNELNNAFGTLSNITFALSIIFIVIYLILFVLNYRKLNEHEYFYSYFFLFGTAGIFGYFLFTKISLADSYILQYPQYFIFNVLFIWILAAIFLNKLVYKKWKENTNNKIKYSFMATFLLISSFSYSTFFGYNDVTYKTVANDLLPLVEIIKKSNYTFGYASHWQGLILNELTQQKVDMYTFVKYADTIKMNQEVQSTYHTDFIRDEKCFIIFKEDETEMPGFKNAIKYGAVLSYYHHFYLIDLPTAKVLNY